MRRGTGEGQPLTYTYTVTHTQTPVDDNKLCSYIFALVWILFLRQPPCQKGSVPAYCRIRTVDCNWQKLQRRFLHETYLGGELEGGEVVVVARHSGHVLHSEPHLLTHQVLTHCLSNTHSFIVSSSPGLRIRINLGSLIQIIRNA